MNVVKLNSNDKMYGTLKYNFVSGGIMEKYFSGNDFVINYSFEISDIPDSILTVPFVCNVLLIIWITDSVLEVKEIDESFFSCVDSVKRAYIAMYPETQFGGEFKADEVVSNINSNGSSRAAMLYSSGVDSLNTLICHIEENPDLVSVWGSDIKYENEQGWLAMHKYVEEAVGYFNLQDVTIRSTFREFDDEWQLDKDFSSQLQDEWWHGIKHGMGLIGHIAPYAYKMHINKVYIASSFCPEDGVIRCASSPSIDNCIRFFDCEISHDGYSMNCQDKLHNIISLLIVWGGVFRICTCVGSHNKEKTVAGARSA